ncbi:MAG: 23S rRNA (pseudouridine(1915)-N(3))-methyltransferase RlmH, partial [Fibrobacterales bacterium]|nr:23S rRNA (pseudouridine(1915)-N(3))-methyltransferase RlmH [Fibrobacterales bacterium]
VGSAYGLDPEFAKRAKWLLSLSPMTLAHDHARVLLIEQLYRALCIQKGHGYHHA